jgi:hypothetical protein
MYFVHINVLKNNFRNKCNNKTIISSRRPRLVIENIKGRFNKISVDIRNIGDQDVASVKWSISVKGGILQRIDLRSTGTINTLLKQSGATVITDRIPLGLERLEITVMVEASGGEPVRKTASGF